MTLALHTTSDSGYGMPDLEKLASAYDITYYDSKNEVNLEAIAGNITEPVILNLRIDENLKLTPFLPIGRKTQDMEPKLEERRYIYINKL